VADIISLDSKQQLSEKQKKEIRKKQKFIAIRKTLHCTNCMSKCEKCGIQINMIRDIYTDTAQKQRIPYRFCENCTDEYLDYIERLKGGGDPDCYWRNELWIETWAKWINYKGAGDSYMKSKEFQQLVEELQGLSPD
jgi:hypothetical protein